MRIAWFTPFGVQSAIGKYSKVAAEALSAYAEVVLFVETQPKMHETSLQVEFYKDGEDVSDVLGTFDLIVYNMGDHCGYHKSVYNVMQKHPGLVIAHDICMHHFFHSYYLDKPDEYKKQLSRLYGEKDADRILEYSKHVVLWTTVDLLKYSMLRLICENARGVMVHSNYHAGELSKVYAGPTAVIPLIEMYEPVWDKADSAEKNKKKKINLLTVGNVNSNKNILKILDAIAGSSFLRKHVYYTVIGEASNIFYEERIRKKVKKEKLSANFQMKGYVEDKELFAYYNQADVICNLRYPALEGGSASLQEQLLQGKAVIVADTGVYSELPDDCVIKINPSQMRASLQKELTRLVNDRSIIDKIGQNARTFAKKEYAKERYASELFDFINKLIFIKPLDDVLQKVKNELNIMGLNTEPGEPRLEIIQNISKNIDEMFAVR